MRINNNTKFYINDFIFVNIRDCFLIGYMFLIVKSV